MGKVDREFLTRVVFRTLGAKRSSLIVMPGHGLDNSVISLGKNQVMIATADPVSMIPSLGMKSSAWLSVQLLASDFTTSGVRPQFAMLDFNLPPSLDMNDLESYLKEIHSECKRLGIAIAGGHTGKYAGCDFTVVGGGFLFGFAAKGEYITPAMAKAGDRVLVTKGAAIATTAVLSNTFPKTVEKRLGPRLLGKARNYLDLCSTVEDAIAAAALGTRSVVTSLHDATEGGVMGGLYELSSACGKTLVVDPEGIPVSEETRGICEAFDLDPLTSLSEGTLIITCKPSKVGGLVDTLREKGIESHEIGEVRKGRPSLLVRKKGGVEEYVPPDRDPYWEAYFSSRRKGWN